MPSSLIQQLEEHITSQFSPDIRSFFQLERLKKPPSSFTPTAIKTVEKNLPLLAHRIAEIEKKFSFRQGVIDLSKQATPEETTLLSLLFLAIDPSQELWQIQTLLIDGCKEISQENLLHFLTQCPNLQEISISNCPQFQDAFLQNLKEPQIEKWISLHLAKTSFSHTALLALLQKTANLVSLDLSDNPQLTTTDMESLQAELPHLRAFTFNGVSQVHGLSIIHFLHTHPDIETLFLNALPQFRSALLPLLREHLGNLQKFSLAHPPLPKPIYYDFIRIGEFIQTHACLREWDLSYISFRVNDLIYAYDFLPHTREIELSLHFRKEDVIFPSTYPKEQHHEKILEIQDAYRDKNILLLL